MLDFCGWWELEEVSSLSSRNLIILLMASIELTKVQLQRCWIVWCKSFVIASLIIFAILLCLLRSYLSSNIFVCPIQGFLITIHSLFLELLQSMCTVCCFVSILMLIVLLSYTLLSVVILLHKKLYLLDNRQVPG